MSRTIRGLLLGASVLLLASLPAQASFYAYSSVTETGSTNIVTVPFPYAEQTDILVFVNGVQTSAWTWLSSSTIQMNASAASLSGSVVAVQRVTQIASPDVTFTTGSLDPADLNTAVLQQLYAAQEASDTFQRTLKAPVGNVLGSLPLPTNCASATLGFDSTGLNPICVTISGGGSVVGPSSTTAGHLAAWNSTTGALLQDYGAPQVQSLLDTTQCINFTASNIGGVGDGVTDNTSAWTAAFAALPSGGGCIFVPPGEYYSSTMKSSTFPSTHGYGLTIVGGGADVTKLLYGGSGAFSLTLSEQDQSLHIRDMTVETTDTVSATHTAILITQSAMYNGVYGQSDITNVTFRGHDGGYGTEYWGNSVSDVGLSNLSFTNDLFFGPNQSVTLGAGNGITLSGNTGVSPYFAVVFNLSNCGFFNEAIGLKLVTYVQGITVSQSNFYAGTFGIDVLSGASGIGQISVSTSEFNTNATQINLVGLANILLVSNNYFILPIGGFGITINSTATSGGDSFTGNQFSTLYGTNTATAIYADGTCSPCVSTGNTFWNVQTAHNLIGSSSGFNIQSNGYSNVTNKVAVPGSNTVGGGSE
jgi:hypothetical protein